MNEHLTERFIHRENGHVSYESICVKCSETVGRRECESELRAEEAEHMCKESTKHRYGLPPAGDDGPPFLPKPRVS
jgi:hypothetical protein